MHTVWYHWHQTFEKVKLFSSDREQIGGCLGPGVKHGKAATRWAKDMKQVYVKERKFKVQGKQVSEGFLIFSIIAILDLIIRARARACVCVCVCVCAGLCTEGCLALSGLYPQNASGNLPQLPSWDNQKCLTTFTNVPWDTRWYPVENHWVSVFIMCCCITNYPSNLVA